MNKYSLNYKIKKEGITDENISLFNTSYDLRISDNDSLFYIIHELVFNKFRKPLEYALEFREDFKLEQYKIYRKFREKQTKDSICPVLFFMMKFIDKAKNCISKEEME